MMSPSDPLPLRRGLGRATPPLDTSDASTSPEQDLVATDAPDLDETGIAVTGPSSAGHLLPLPTVCTAFDDLVDLGKRASRSASSLVEGVLCALNALYGSRVNRPLLGGAVHGSVPGPQKTRRETKRRLEQIVASSGTPPLPASSAEAVCHFLNSSSPSRLEREGRL